MQARSFLSVEEAECAFLRSLFFCGIWFGADCSGADSYLVEQRVHQATRGVVLSVPVC